MKHMKKVLTLVLALIMVMGLATTASAYTITMAPSADGSSVAGHTYEVYQIYTGTMSIVDGKETLGDVKYGQDYFGMTAGALVPETELDEVAAMGGAAAAAYFEQLVDDSPIATLDDTNNHTSADLPTGYYLIIDVSDDLPDTETASAFILEVLDDVAVNSKHTSSPIVEKKIDDINDSTGEGLEIQWHDSADHDIGDEIPFQLKAVIPSSIESFRANNVAYPFTFHDTEEKGLTFAGITSAYVLNGDTKTELTAGTDYTLVNPATDGHTFDVVFADLTKIAAIQSGSVLIVEYKSELNEEAILGNQGNVNEVFGEYRNYNEPETPAFTPKDTVIAFTYKVIVNKVDENGEELVGAEFTLEKFDKATNTWIAIAQVETTSETVFEFKGLDDGQYRLTETDTPDGYNTIDPIEFTVTAEHDIEWETETRTDLLTSLSGDVETGEIQFTASTAEGSLTTDVVNQKGATLPETGGIGTTIFYVVGGLLAVAAVVLLVTKKRMASAE